jgi:hypothetical protein
MFIAKFTIRFDKDPIQINHALDNLDLEKEIGFPPSSNAIRFLLSIAPPSYVDPSKEWIYT